MPDWSFMIQVNDDEPVAYQSAHSQYRLVVLEAFGRLSMPYPCTVQIWVDELFPFAGPYEYRIDDFVDVRGNHYGSPAVLNAGGQPEFWSFEVGDIVTRDGTDEHEITAINDAGDLLTLLCIKAPEDPWASVGETEENTARRYSLVRKKAPRSGTQSEQR